MRKNIKVAKPTETGQLLVLLVLISYRTCWRGLSLAYELEVGSYGSLETFRLARWNLDRPEPGRPLKTQLDQLPTAGLWWLLH